MQRESDDSLSRAPWHPIASGTGKQEAERQQEAIIREEERSTDALARAEGATFPAVDACSDDYAALVERGRQLTVTLAELVVTNRMLRTAAKFARQEAVLTRDRSTSVRTSGAIQSQRYWKR